MNLIRKVFFLSVAAVLVSCNQEVPKDYVLLSGSITNGQVEQLIINDLDRNVKGLITINQDGTFSDTIRLAEGTYSLNDGINNINVQIDYGRDVTINYDVNDKNNTLSFKGEGSPESIFMFEKEKMRKELMGSAATVYALEEGAYLNRLTEIRTKLMNLLAFFEGISDEFIALEKRNLYYNYLNNLSIYERYHAHYTKKPDFKVSDGFLGELNAIDYNNEIDYKVSKEYRRLVQAYNLRKIVALVKRDSVPYELASLKVYSTITNDHIRNTLLLNAAKIAVTFKDDFETPYALFMEGSTNEEHKKEITDVYNKLKKVSTGNSSPKFSNFENYAGGTLSLDDLNGKYVFINVWATWCGPCKPEFPYLAALEKKYSDRNIVFVSLSVDSEQDREKWRTMIEEEALGGIQLFADKSFASRFVQDYLIQGIPRYVLIDPEGIIVSPNAPRPSQKALLTLFDENKI